MNNKPQIIVFCSDKVKEENIKEILWGIEEEGIPHYLEFLPDEDIVKVRFTSGRLEVGIGVKKDGSIILNSRKYDKEYIEKCSINDSETTLRNIGSNSARLVKGLPLK